MKNYNMSVSGLSFAILTCKYGILLEPDFFLGKQISFAEEMKLQKRRIKLDHKFAIALPFEPRRADSIGVLLHELHLREMSAFVNGYREKGGKFEGVSAFFEKYHITNEYDLESAYRYVKTKKYAKIENANGKNNAITIHIQTESFKAPVLIEKVRLFFELQKGFYKKIRKTKKHQYIASLSYYLLYEYSHLKQTDIAKLFKKSDSRVSESINKFRRLLDNDNVISDISSILES